MTYEEYEDELWLEDFITLPRSLQPPVRFFGATRRFAVLDAISEELGLATNDVGRETWLMLDTLVRVLGYAVEDGKALTEGQPLAVAETTVANINIDIAVGTMVELGWGRTQVRQVPVSELAMPCGNALRQSSLSTSSRCCGGGPRSARSRPSPHPSYHPPRWRGLDGACAPSPTSAPAFNYEGRGGCSVFVEEQGPNGSTRQSLGSRSSGVTSGSASAGGAAAAGMR